MVGILKLYIKFYKYIMLFYFKNVDGCKYNEGKREERENN